MISIRRGGERLGNQLFQLAFLYAMHKKYGVDYTFPNWEFADYFDFKHPSIVPSDKDAVLVDEMHFHFSPSIMKIANNQNYVFKGYFQSFKYWDGVEHHIKEIFQINGSYTAHMADRIKHFNQELVAVHIRKGDYRTHPYVSLSPKYYIDIIDEHFHDNKKYRLLVFTDDYRWAKQAIGHYPHVIFDLSDINEIGHLALMTQCDHFICANSTFGWWGAYLGEKEHSKIFRPSKIFKGRLRENNEEDFWPSHWTKVEYDQPYFDLSDATFIIPVAYDHPDRKQNLNLTVHYLRTYFNTNIIIGEICKPPHYRTRFKYTSKYADYIQFNMEHFHRTKILNDMTKAAKTDIVVNWDADVFVDPHGLYSAITSLRGEFDMIYPYDGRFIRMDRKRWYPVLSRDIELMEGMNGYKVGMKYSSSTSYGGAIAYRKDKFIEAGMENENFISHGPEDYERYIRFNKLGFKVGRTEGALYHLDHWCGPDSGQYHKYAKHNRKEYHRIQKMSPEDLNDYVNGWGWSKIKIK
jgi:hypothetical protein